MSSISSFDIISVIPEPKIFLCITASAANVSAVNPNGVKTLLANELITFVINCNPVFNIGPRNIPRNTPDCIILNNWVFDSIISVDELIAKALQRFATYLLVKRKSCEKLTSSSELRMIFDDNLKTTSLYCWF